VLSSRWSFCAACSTLSRTCGGPTTSA
jgi:hypothetical protein